MIQLSSEVSLIESRWDVERKSILYKHEVMYISGGKTKYNYYRCKECGCGRNATFYCLHISSFEFSLSFFHERVFYSLNH